MKIKDIDITLLEQSQRDPLLRPGARDTSGNTILPKFQPNPVQDIGMPMGAVGGSNIGVRKPTPAMTTPTASLANIRTKIDQAYPMSDFVRTGKREPTGPITDKPMQWTRKDPVIGSPTTAGNVSKTVATAGGLPVPATKQTADLGVSSRIKQMPGAGMPITNPGFTDGQKAAMMAAGAAVGGAAGTVYNMAGSDSTSGTPPYVAPTQTASQQSLARSAAPVAQSPVSTSAAPAAVNNRNIANQVQSFAQASGISDPNKISVGQRINLPGGGSYTVKPGDNLWNISKKFLGGNLRESLDISDIKKLAGL